MSSSAATAELTERFSFRQRLALALITAAGWLLVCLIGPTLRYTISIEEGGPAGEWMCPAVYVFWHRCVHLPACVLFDFPAENLGVECADAFRVGCRDLEVYDFAHFVFTSGDAKNSAMLFAAT